MALDYRNSRTPEAEVDSMFIDRWSPRAFSDKPLTDCQLAGLFEAARWAPSCYNEQPWLFIYAIKPKDRERFLEALVPGNQVWARRAPVLMFALARRRFQSNDKDNRHAAFDTGAAWMSIALQARRLGLHAHAMAGFSRQKAYKILNVPENDYDILAAIAVGQRCEPSVLSKEVAAQEKPNQRQPLVNVFAEGQFKKLV
ncbi:MAG: nitroreductase family protein [Deltaproteobacteria bacterium]|jgi:nitroreductase|nr:nitroreductase family protein [Deltaproteobacteria bacterium]MBW2520362.1 nitroreductase family protein [Deltaproteobacteria bacterium]